MRSVTRLLLVALFGLVVALPIVPAASAAPAEVGNAVASAQPPATPVPPPPTVTTAPGVELDPAQTEADRTESRRKLIMGLSSVVLLAIVIWGRSARKKRRKKSASATTT